MIRSFKHRGLKRLYEHGDRSGIRPDLLENVEDILARRTKMAETKIAQAEAQAVADVRAAAAAAAVAAAEKILKETVHGKVADGLIAKGIEDLGALSG